MTSVTDSGPRLRSRGRTRAPSSRDSSTSTYRMRRSRSSRSPVQRAQAGGPIPARAVPDQLFGRAGLRDPRAGDRGRAMWEAVIAAGEPSGLMPYGTEAMSTLRIEKGHIVVGPEADGRTTADDLGMDKLVSPAKWCIGKPLLDSTRSARRRSLAAGRIRPRSTARRCRVLRNWSPIPTTRRRTGCWVT